MDVEQSEFLSVQNQQTWFRHLTVDKSSPLEAGKMKRRKINTSDFFSRLNYSEDIGARPTHREIGSQIFHQCLVVELFIKIGDL
jgi:hypothetical protein